MGIKSVYYFPPSAWSGSVKRAGKIADMVDAVITAFKFTADTYDKGGIPHFYAGHPLVDYMQKWKNADRGEVLTGLGLAKGPVYVALLPGSRTQEIKHLLPLLVEVGNELKKSIDGVHFLMPIASPALNEMIFTGLKEADFPITTFDGRSADVMSISRLIIMASGSASLEASILETPFILTYRLNNIDYRIIKLFVKLRWAGLPNLILGREIVPEFIQENATVENICREAKDLIADGEKRQKTISDLKELNESLGEPGVVARIARFIIEKVL
jgi:lipid-A-disaccharide synthase